MKPFYYLKYLIYVIAELKEVLMATIKKLNIFTSNAQVESENVLIKKSKNGCNDSFEKLMILYEDYLYKMAYLYVKNEQDALDGGTPRYV